MSILSNLKTFLTTNATPAGLASGAPVWTDFLGPNPPQYDIVPLPGSRIVEAYVNGGSLRQFPFAFQSVESAADELERIDNSGFFEALAAWFETTTEAGTLPSLGSGQTATAIEATGWAFLYQQGDSQTGIYQIQCRLEYEQEP